MKSRNTESAKEASTASKSGNAGNAGNASKVKHKPRHQNIAKEAKASDDAAVNSVLL